MNRAARDHADEVAKRIPALRIGTDEDMAGIAIYLASRAGDYVIGNTIAVDGGVVSPMQCSRSRGKIEISRPTGGIRLSLRRCRSEGALPRPAQRYWAGFYFDQRPPQLPASCASGDIRDDRPGGPTDLGYGMGYYDTARVDRAGRDGPVDRVGGRLCCWRGLPGGSVALRSRRAVGPSYGPP